MKLTLILTLSLLLVECNFMGLTHGPGEKVVFLDGSEILVPIDPVRLNSSFNYKAVTTNQDVADATAFPFTWRGGTIRPLAPVNVRGTRDSEGNLLIEWTRRSRIGPGLRPGSDVPLGEEFERYEIDILDGSNNVLRTIVADLTQGEPAVLIARTTEGGVVGNSMEVDLSSGVSVVATTQQQLDRVGSFIEARLFAPPLGVANFANLGFLEPQYAPIAGTIGLNDLSVYRSNLGFTVTGSPAGITISENATGDPPPTTQKFTSGSLGSVSAVRIRAVINTTGIDYYWDFTGPGSVPFYRSDLPAPLPLVANLSVTGPGAKIQDVFVGDRRTPSTTYTTEQQILDFGSIQSVVRIRVYQVSNIIGRGAFRQAEV